MKERVLSLALCGLLLLTGCQNETVQEEIWELEAEDAAVFADGEAADRWRGYQNGLREPWVLYELSDGTVLLQENDTGGPEGSAAYAALSEDVQAAVSAWYQGEGARYDLTALLQACYDRYQAVGSEAFEPGLVAQTAAATAASEKAVYLVTTVEQAVDPAAGEMLRYGTAFDRATGQRLEVWSLFTKPEAEARLALAAAAGDDPDIQARLAEAIDPQHILFFEDRLEIDFPAGAFEGLDTGYILSVDYARLDGVLDPSALPGRGGSRSGRLNFPGQDGPHAGDVHFGQDEGGLGQRAGGGEVRVDVEHVQAGVPGPGGVADGVVAHHDAAGGVQALLVQQQAEKAPVRLFAAAVRREVDRVEGVRKAQRPHLVGGEDGLRVAQKIEPAAFGPQHGQHLGHPVVKAEIAGGHGAEKLPGMDGQGLVRWGAFGLEQRLEHARQLDLGVGLVAVAAQALAARRLPAHLGQVGRAQLVGGVAGPVVAVKAGQRRPGGGLVLVGMDIDKRAV